MFWSKKDKKKSLSKASPQEKDKAKALAELQKNAQKAREAIGEETLQKLAAQIAGKDASITSEPSPMIQAQNILKQMDSGRLADNLRAMAKDVSKDTSSKN